MAKKQMLNYDLLMEYRTGINGRMISVIDVLRKLKSEEEIIINDNLWYGPNGDVFKDTLEIFWKKDSNNNDVINYLEEDLNQMLQFIDDVIKENSGVDSKESVIFDEVI